MGGVVHARYMLDSSLLFMTTYLGIWAFLRSKGFWERIGRCIRN